MLLQIYEISVGSSRCYPVDKFYTTIGTATLLTATLRASIKSQTLQPKTPKGMCSLKHPKPPFRSVTVLKLCDSLQGLASQRGGVEGLGITGSLRFRVKGLGGAWGNHYLHLDVFMV